MRLNSICFLNGRVHFSENKPKINFYFLVPSIKNASGKGDNLMEVTPSDTAALPVASAAPTLATAWTRERAPPTH